MIRVADIRQEWDRIKDAVAALCTDDRPEDVYAACKHDAATLLVCEEGFAVVVLETAQHTGQKQLFVWKCHCPGGLEKYQSELDEIARKYGASSMYMSSRRKGWQNTPGWDEDTTFYRRAL